ncbi:hypothetical protein U1Q18_011350, partial [Sarracenia purpurea var. burkii]
MWKKEKVNPIRKRSILYIGVEGDYFVLSEHEPGTRDAGAPQRVVEGVGDLYEGQDLVRVLAEAMRIVEATISMDRGPLVARTGIGRQPTTVGPDIPLTGHQFRKRKFKSSDHSCSPRVPQQPSLTPTPPTIRVRRS